MELFNRLKEHVTDIIPVALALWHTGSSQNRRSSRADMLTPCAGRLVRIWTGLLMPRLREALTRWKDADPFLSALALLRALGSAASGSELSAIHLNSLFSDCLLGDTWRNINMGRFTVERDDFLDSHLAILTFMRTEAATSSGEALWFQHGFYALIGSVFEFLVRTDGPPLVQSCRLYTFCRLRPQCCRCGNSNWCSVELQACPARPYLSQFCSCWNRERRREHRSLL